MKYIRNYKTYLIPLSVLLVLALTSSFGTWDGMESRFYDAFYNFKGACVPGGDVVVVAIDEASTKELGPFERWDRRVHARLISQMEKASVIGFDIVFDSRTSSEADTEVASAIAKQGRIVLGSEIVFRNQGGAMYSTMQPPIPEFARGCFSLGFMNFPTDPDNVVRRSTLINGKPGGRLFPSFDLAAVLAAKGLSPGDLKFQDGHILAAGDLDIPLDTDNRLLMNFWGPGGTFKTYSYIDVLRGKYDPDEFSGKIILVGSTGATEHDYFQTPFTKGNLVLNGALPTPGVELHAAAVETILSGAWFQRASAAVNVAFIFFAGLLAVSGIVRRGPLAGFLTVLGVTFLVLLVSYIAWDKSRYWLNVAAPLLTVFLMYTGVTVENYIHSEMERRRTRALFSRYVNKELVDHIMRNHGKVSLGGIRREVTVLFADMRGFTELSSQTEPEETFLILNRYLSLMTEIIFKYGGMLDKYTGDGLMAVFGTPVPHQDHALRAVKAAMEITEKIEGRVKIGIGISSGSVVAGNVGSLERMDYTVIGEDVNLASRLEQLTKELGVNVLISEHTAASLAPGESGQKFVLKNLGPVEIRGFLRPVEVFTVDLIK